MKKSTFGIFILILVIVGFQNCTRLSFNGQEQESATSNSLDSNGGGYTGFHPEKYFRYMPAFTCGQSVSPVAMLSVSKDSAQLTENHITECAARQTTLDLAVIDRSVFQTGVVGYEEGIFAGNSDDPNKIPNNLVEAWCRDSNDFTGIETMMHFDRSTKAAVNRTYYSTNASSTGAVSVADFPVSRVVSGKMVSIKDGNGFELVIYRDQPSSQTGLFKAHLNTVLDGKKYSRETNCRLGGSLDPKVWPAKQIVDANVLNFALAPSLTSIAFTSQGPGTQLYAAQSDGSNLRNLSQTSGVQETNSMFSLSPDGNVVVYEVDVGGQAANLNVVSINGGTPVVINPMIGSATNALPLGSKSQNKFIYSWGLSPKDIYSVNANGTGNTKITPLLTANQQFLNLIAPFAGIFDDFLLANVIENSNTIRQFAMPVDGSASFALPASASWTSIIGPIAFGTSNSDQTLRVFNLKNKSDLSLSAQLSSAVLTQDGRSLLLQKQLPDGIHQQAISLNLANSFETIICPKISASKIVVRELNSDDVVFVNFSPMTQLVEAYRASRDGTTCAKVNSSLTTNVDLESLGSVTVSPDRMKVLVQLRAVKTGAGQLLYVPLDGGVSYVVDTPVTVNAGIRSSAFLSDSKTILYTGNQIGIGQTNVFVWKAP